MSDKIRLLENLKSRTKNLKMGDQGEVESIRMLTKMAIRNCFGPSSNYLEELKTVIYITVKPNQDVYSHYLCINWNEANGKMLRLLDVMVEDIKLSKNEKKDGLNTKSNSNEIFVVHGTDHQPVKELSAILVESGLNPIILHEQPSKGLTIIEKLEEYSGNIGFAFIILTPDDKGFSGRDVEDLISSLMHGQSLTQQELFACINSLPRKESDEFVRTFMALFRDRARQNVVLEFGYFIGLLKRSHVCCLYKGDLELPSDMHGICYVHFKQSVTEVKNAILEELKAAGYDV